MLLTMLVTCWLGQMSAGTLLAMPHVWPDLAMHCSVQAATESWRDQAHGVMVSWKSLLVYL